MQIRISSLVHAAIGAGIVGAAALFAQPTSDPRPPQPGTSKPDVSQRGAAQPTTPAHPDHGQPRLEEGLDEEKVKQAWIALAKPGKPHQFLQSLAGEYTTVNRMWMNPKAPPSESTGKATFTAILGGRYLQQDYHGTMMDRPMNGLGLMGYDNYRHQFMSVWIDDMGTAPYSMTGGMGEDGKTITMFGQMDEASTKQIGKTVKWVTRSVSSDKLVFESWEVECDTPMKVFEIEYTRVK